MMCTKQKHNTISHHIIRTARSSLKHFETIEKKTHNTYTKIETERQKVMSQVHELASKIHEKMEEYEACHEEKGR